VTISFDSERAQTDVTLRQCGSKNAKSSKIWTLPILTHHHLCLRRPLWQ